MTEPTLAQGENRRGVDVRVYDIILKKRRGCELSEEEINLLISRYTQGDIPDYQMSAFLMAVFFQGMSVKETHALTMAMAHSGETVDLSAIHGVKVDKHSTGGVGDKTTLVLAPLVASLGVPVAKMSGRGLGHTGGTLDKLESIPGFRVDLSKEEFVEAVNRVGIAVVGQTASIAPADKKLYALRDVTATVDSIQLIAASVCSKKLACGADAIVFDVKTGKGAFMKSQSDAEHLAELMVDIVRQAGRRGAALVSDMDQPLGYAVGNSLEVAEAIDTLRGEGPEDLRELCLSLGSLMIVLGGKAKSIEEARRNLEDSLNTGAALDKFRDLVFTQGGNAEVVDDPESLLPSARCLEAVPSSMSGYIKGINAENIGVASMMLGAGRRTKEDAIDPAAGIIILKKIGDRVEQGEPLAMLHTNDWHSLEPAAKLVMSSYEISEDKCNPPQLIYKVIEK